MRTRHRGHVAWKDIRLDSQSEDRSPRRGRNNSSNSSGSCSVSDAFAVRHYAGLVQYSLRPLEQPSSQSSDSQHFGHPSKSKALNESSSSEGQWIELNHFSSWPSELPSLLASSIHPAVRALAHTLPGYKNVLHGTGGGGAAAVATTVVNSDSSSNDSSKGTSHLSIAGDNNQTSATAASELCSALARLQTTLSECEISYVRCLRPHNRPLVPQPITKSTVSHQLFDRAYVAAQVRTEPIIIESGLHAIDDLSLFPVI